MVGLYTLNPYKKTTIEAIVLFVGGLSYGYFLDWVIGIILCVVAVLVVIVTIIFHLKGKRDGQKRTIKK